MRVSKQARQERFLRRAAQVLYAVLRLSSVILLVDVWWCVIRAQDLDWKYMSVGVSVRTIAATQLCGHHWLSARMLYNRSGARRFSRCCSVVCVDSSLQITFRYKAPPLRYGMVLSALTTCCFCVCAVVYAPPWHRQGSETATEVVYCLYQPVTGNCMCSQCANRYTAY
jgi:hypothetical protein